MAKKAGSFGGERCAVLVDLAGEFDASCALDDLRSGSFLLRACSLQGTGLERRGR